MITVRNPSILVLLLVLSCLVPTAIAHSSPEEQLAQIKVDDPDAVDNPDAMQPGDASGEGQRPSISPPVTVPPDPNRTFSPSQSLPQGTTLTIAGSSSMEVITRGLIEGFKQSYPNAKVSFVEGTSDEAIASLLAGKADLAAIGRSLRDDEKAQGLAEVSVSREKIAVIVGSNNPYQMDLEAQDFVRIFRGEIKNWAELGGPDLPIRFIDRPATSDTRAALGGYEIFGGNLTAGANAVQVPEDSTAEVVAALGDNGLGYAIASQVLGQENVRVLSMHTTLPDDPRYPYSQPRNYVYRSTNPLPAQVESFLGFVTNADGKAVVAQAKAAEANDVAVADLPDHVLAMRPNGQGFVTGDRAGNLRFWHANGTSAGDAVAAHVGPVTALAFSGDGQRLVSGGADGTLRLWDAIGNPIGSPINTGNGPVTQVLVQPDGSFISASANGTLQRWDTLGNPVGAPLVGHEGAVRDMVLSADGTTLTTASKDGTLRRWNLKTGEMLGAPLVGHQGAVQAVAMLPNGTLFSGGADGTVRRWDANGIEVGAPTQVAGPVNAIAPTPDGTRLAIGDNTGSLQFLNPDGTPLGAPLTDNPGPIDALAYTPDGQRLVVSTGETPQLRGSTGQIIPIPQQPSPEVGVNPSLPPELAELWAQIKNLPPQVWWLLPFLLLGLLLLGLLRSFREDDDKAVSDRPLPDPNPDLPQPTPDPSPTYPDYAPGGSGQWPTQPPQPGLATGGIDTSLGKAKQTLAEGVQLSNAGLHQEALDCFNKAIEMADLERMKATAAGVSLVGATAVIAQGLARRGATLANLGRTDEAVQSLNRALEMDPNEIIGWIGKGNVFCQLNQWDEALFCFDKAIDLNPNLASAWQGKGQVLQKMGREAEARSCFAKAESLGGLNQDIPIDLSTPSGSLPTPSYPGQPYPGGIEMPTVSPGAVADGSLATLSEQGVSMRPPARPPIEPGPPIAPDPSPVAPTSYPTGSSGISPEPMPLPPPPSEPILTNPEPAPTELVDGAAYLGTVPGDNSLPPDLAAAIANLPSDAELPLLAEGVPAPLPEVGGAVMIEPIGLRPPSEKDPSLPVEVQQTLEYVPAATDEPPPNAPVAPPAYVPPEVTAILESEPARGGTEAVVAAHDLIPGAATAAGVADPMAAFFGNDPTVSMRPPARSPAPERAASPPPISNPDNPDAGIDYDPGLAGIPADVLAALQGIPEGGVENYDDGPTPPPPPPNNPRLRTP